MMLPFFIIAYAGLYYMHGLYTARQQALTKARACAWEYARNACTSVPAGCEAVSGDAVWSSGSTEDPSNSASSGGGSILSNIRSVPVVGTLIGGVIDGIFGRPLRADASHETRFTPKFAPQARTVGGEYFTLCNTEPRTWGQVARDIFCGFVGDFMGCG